MSDAEAAGRAAREASAQYHLRFGGFFYDGRPKPYVIREYGRRPSEVIFETADRDEYDAAIQRVEDEFIGRAALQTEDAQAIAHGEYRNQVIQELIEKADHIALDGRTPAAAAVIRSSVAEWLLAQMEGE